MRVRHPQETVDEALSLIDGGMSHAEVATKLGINKANIGNWVIARKRSGRITIGKYPGRGYVPVIRPGMETVELLCPETLAEFRRWQAERRFQVEAEL